MPKKATQTSVRKEFRGAPFSGFTKDEISIIARELGVIEDEHGEVTPRLIVELAANKSHPLHPLVYKDNQREAAQKWYLQRAREICRAVRVIYIDDDDNDVAEAPMLASVPVATVETDDESGEVQIRTRRYISVERAFADPAVADAMLKEALLQADAWKSRYSHLQALRPVFAAITSVKKTSRKKGR